MQNGVSVWLDVPLEALAQRIAAVGTNSRPLLHNDSGNEYTKVASLFTILFFIYAMVSNQAKKGIHISHCLSALQLLHRFSGVCLLCLKREVNVMRMPMLGFLWKVRGLHLFKFVSIAVFFVIFACF